MNIRTGALLLALILFFLMPGVAYSNGGPIDGSILHGTGNVKLIGNKNILLVEETIRLTINGDFVDAEVEYTFNNKGHKTALVYGFPVQWAADPDLMDKWDEKRMVPFFTIIDSGRKLTVRSVEEDGSSSEGSVSRELTRWYYTKITFPKGEKKIAIRYRAKCTFTDFLTSKSFLPGYSERKFFYNLVPSGNWGDGHVKKLSITVDTKEAVRNGIKMKKVQFSRPLEQEDGLYSVKLENVSLKKLGRLLLEYEVSSYKLNEIIKTGTAQKKHIEYIKASSTLQGDYHISKAFDRDLKTTWAEGKKGHGRGEWIEIGIRQNFNVSGVAIVNGLMVNERLYHANSRIKKVRVVMQIPTIEGGKQEREIQLEDMAYPKSNHAVLSDFMTMLVEFGDWSPPVRRIRIYIEDVYPGSKYSDTCISEVFIFGNEKRKGQ